jgi:hypothetical protein
VFIDELFENDFYQRLPLGYHTNHCFGQVFWTHAHYSFENIQFWRPVIDPNEPTKTIASSFNMVGWPPDAFRRSFPLHAPSLKTDEEFIVVKAKRRPVVLIQSEPSLVGVKNPGYRGKFSRQRTLVAQMFSIVDKRTGEAKYDNALVERVRRMEFPQLLFMPKMPGFVDSFLRLDEPQSVFVPHLEPTDTCLGTEVQNVLKHQLRFLLTGDGPTYTDLRHMLLNS